MFECLQVEASKYQNEEYEVILMGNFNARIKIGSEEHPNSNGRRLLIL